MYGKSSGLFYFAAFDIADFFWAKLKKYTIFLPKPVKSVWVSDQFTTLHTCVCHT